MFRLNQHLEVVSDRIDYGKMHHTDIDALLLSKGFKKDPERVKKMDELREKAEKDGSAAELRQQRENLRETAKFAKGHWDKEKEAEKENKDL